MKIHDYHLHVEDLGNPKGEVVVFLNGVMASTSSWYQLMKYFITNDYRVILHDFRGQLKSDPIDERYTFKQHAEDTIAILKNLNIKHAHFVGTSYGGEVALNIGFRFKSYVDSLTIIDSVASLDDALKEKINRWIDLAQTKDGSKFFKGMVKDIYSGNYILKNIEMLEARAIKMRELPEHYLKGQIKLYETFLNDVSMLTHLSDISSPTLIVCGDKDMLKPLKFSKEIHKAIKGSQYVILPDTGHVAIFEKHHELETLHIGFSTKHQHTASR